jgi:hypothetical protein
MLYCCLGLTKLQDMLLQKYLVDLYVTVPCKQCGIIYLSVSDTNQRMLAEPIGGKNGFRPWPTKVSVDPN